MTNPWPWKITPRQAEVMSALTEEGESNESISRRMGIAQATVEKHLYAVYEAMGARSRVDAALMWDRWARAQDNRSTA